MAIEENENIETNLDELIERLEQDDIPTNIFTVEDTDPMVLLGKMNEVIARLRDINSSIPTKTSQLLNDGDNGTTEYATKAYLDSEDFYISRARIINLFNRIGE